MDRQESATTNGIRRRGLLKGAGSAIALGGGSAFIGAPFLSWPAVAAATTTYQAESAKIYHGKLETLHGGFSGSGYADTFQQTGSYVEWVVTVAQAATATLIIRYANGSNVNRPMAVRVNGAVVIPALSFVPTGGWSSWATRSLTAAMHAGTNTVRLTSTTPSGGPNIDLLEVNDGTDWGRAVVDSTIARNPDAAAFGSWAYYRAFYLLGQYRVYQRTRDSTYLDYIKAWVDAHVDANGKIDASISLLDNILPGNLLLILHRETGLKKYRLAADTIRKVFDTYPKTSDGASGTRPTSKANCGWTAPTWLFRSWPAMVMPMRAVPAPMTKSSISS